LNASKGTVLEIWPAVFAKRIAVAVCLIAGPFASNLASSISQDIPTPLAERARGAERVVVGRVASVDPAWRVNEHGDRLIVSMVRVVVDETLKGQRQPTLDLEVEGGTIGDLTLRVSDQASLAPGERAVFLVSRNPRGAFIPHLRGQGLLKLDRSDRVPGSSLTLEEIRRTVAGQAAR
jgi:hypothetical protein